MNDLQNALAAKLAVGKKLFIPYITGGLPSPQGFVDLFGGLAQYADAIEVGIPFSDPIMDGPVIQSSSTKAIELAVTPELCMSQISEAIRYSPIPVVVMTYYNPILQMGEGNFVKMATDAGVGGAIVPDLPFEESVDLSALLGGAGLAHIQMVAPTTSEERAAMLARASTGFIYGVSRMGVTGDRQDLSEAARKVVARIRPHALAPVMLGVGIATPEQASTAGEYADGVIVGSALVKLVLKGDIEGAVDLARNIRRSLESK